MKQTINEYQFRDAFRDIRPDNFSHEGLGVLFESLEQLGDDTGQEAELDVIALCCEFSESTVEEIIDNYEIDVSQAEDDSDKADIVMEYLNDHTYFVGQLSNGSMIYQAF